MLSRIFNSVLTSLTGIKIPVDRKMLPNKNSSGLSRVTYIWLFDWLNYRSSLTIKYSFIKFFAYIWLTVVVSAWNEKIWNVIKVLMQRNFTPTFYCLSVKITENRLVISFTEVRYFSFFSNFACVICRYHTCHITVHNEFLVLYGFLLQFCSIFFLCCFKIHYALWCHKYDIGILFKAKFLKKEAK